MLRTFHRRTTLLSSARSLLSTSTLAVGPNGDAKHEIVSVSPKERAKPGVWVRKILRDFPQPSIEAVKRENGTACLIGDTKATMAHKYIDMHGALGQNIEAVQEVLKKDPDARQKPLLATVKGTGGGKTRLMEEMRRSLNRREDTVAIGITFNNRTEYSKAENLIRDDEYLAFNLMLSVMARIVAIVYDKPLADVVDAFIDCFEELDYKSMRNTLRGANFFRSFLDDIAESLATSDDTGKVKNLVILVDEIMRLRDENIRRIEEAAKRDRIIDEFEVFLSALNKGILNERLGGATGREWNAALLISSLEVSALHKTASSRWITLLPTGELEAKEIVRKWWRKNIHLEKSNSASSKLQLVAEVLRNMPRLLELAKSSLAKQAEKASETEPLKIDAKVVRSLFREVLETIRIAYTFNKDVDPLKTFALVFGQEVALDSESISLMRNSYFTNTLKEIQGSDKTRKSFVPQGNLAMLAFYDLLESEDVAHLMKAETNWNDPQKIFFNVFRAVIDSISTKSAEGDALEQATLGWLLARLVTAHKTGMTEMPLHELFGVADAYLSLDGPIRVKIPRLAHHVFDARQLSTLHPISKDVAHFARKFNAIELNQAAVATVFKTHRLQNFDKMAVFTLANTDDLFVVFIDNKSKQIMDRVESLDKQTKSLNVTQFFDVQELVKTLVTLEESGTKLSAISKALVEGRYRFVYMTSHTKLELELYKIPDHLVVMTADESQKFFGIIWDWYRAARAML